MNLGMELMAATVPRFSCGHPKIPANAYVVMVKGQLVIRCRECHRIQARDYQKRRKE